MIKAAEPKGDVNIPSCSVFFVLLAATAIKPAWKRRVDHFQRIRSIIDINWSTSQAAIFHHHRRYAREDTKLYHQKNRVRSCSHRIGRRRQQIKRRRSHHMHHYIVRSGGASGISSIRVQVETDETEN